MESSRNCVAKVALPLPIDRLFDYHIPPKLREAVKIGMRAKVSFNNKIAFGFIVGLSSHSHIKKLNPIIALLDNHPLLTASSLELAKKMKDYYICSLGEAIFCMLPHHFKNTKDVRLDNPLWVKHKKETGNRIVYVQGFRDNTLGYIKDEISRRLKDKKRIIMLVPEVQMIDRIKEKLFKDAAINIAVWHGGLTRKEALNLWNNLSQDKIDVLIGTRSAVFAPINNLDLIVMENEGDYAYKEDQVPYYEALDVVRMRAQTERYDVMLSSIVPSSWAYKLILDDKITIKKTGEDRSLAEIKLSRTSYKDKIDFMIENEIASALEKRQKILIFLNRKGFATFIYCKNCKDALRCDRCSSNLRFEYSEKKLICPSCNQRIEATEICPKCNSTYVKYGGLGLEKLESSLKRIFPQAKVIKFDEKINKDADYDIMLATQKILNFDMKRPDITIVWNLDSMLNIGDFDSSQNLFRSLGALLNITSQKMIIGTSLNPEYYLLKNLAGIDFEHFYGQEFSTRKELKLPPYYNLVLVSIRSLNRENSEKVYTRMFSFFEKAKSRQIVLSSPDTRLRARIREKYYKYLLIKSKNIKLLNNIIKKATKEFRSGGVIITVNINPK